MVGAVDIADAEIATAESAKRKRLRMVEAGIIGRRLQRGRVNRVSDGRGGC